MKSSSWIASTTAALMLAGLSAQAQLPKDPEERAKVLAQIMQANARQITLFDREGTEVERVGSRDLYNQVILSPDRTRIAVIKADLEKEANDLWLLDTASGKGPQITFSVVQAAGAFAGKPLAVEERQFRWGTIHFRNAGEVS